MVVGSVLSRLERQLSTIIPSILDQFACCNVAGWREWPLL